MATRPSAGRSAGTISHAIEAGGMPAVRWNGSETHQKGREMSSSTGLWAELKRRNVFRVAAAYIVVGWLTLQVAEILLGFTGAPEWVGKALIALLLLGLVPALALAWVFEVGPEGVRRDDGSNARDASPQARRLDVITLGAVVLVVVLLAWQHLGPALTGTQDGGAEKQAAAPATADPPPVPRTRPEPPPFEVPAASVAVLPFANRSAEPDSAYFVDGIHDDLLTQLARNGALTVISRTSMMEYRDTTKNLRQIGEELGVATVLEGAVQRAGRRVRINAQLIDARSDAHLWAETFDRELTPENIFDIQSEIALAISAALGQALGAGAAGREDTGVPTRNAEAFDLYLRARATRDETNEDSIRARIVLYRQALEHDPQFALAMGELGREFVNLFWYTTRRDADHVEGRRWLDRALALQPDNPQLQLAMAEYHYRAHLDYDAALAELDRATRGLPGSAEALLLRAAILRRAGRTAETFDAFHSAVLLDPRSVEIIRNLAETYWLTGDIEAVRRWHDRLDVLPDAREVSRLIYAVVRMNVLGDLELIESEMAALSPDVLIRNGYVESFTVPYFKRDFGRAAELLEASADLYEDQFSLRIKALARAYIERAQGNERAAAMAARTALATADAILAEHTDDYRAMMVRAQALAMLGDGPAAREATRQALAQTIPTHDGFIRSEQRMRELMVLAMVADSVELAGAMEGYLQLEMKLWQFDGLVLDPVFDAHRDHPAIRALAAKYSRHGSGS
jgi:TolB-like protein/Flp pilus assembly protein TadD